jgi:metal-responsive CopG/Arc/MetJ family transcriptional regulator
VPRQSAKIAISLDEALLARVSRVQRATGESRSAVVGRALRQFVAEDERRALVEEYVAAYRRTPESTEDVATAREMARRALAHLAWEDE